MNLGAMLRERAAAGRPLRVALVGAGKFGTMWLAQAVRTPGVHVVAVADLVPERARAALATAGFAPERTHAASVAEAVRTGGTFVTEDAEGLLGAGELEIAGGRHREPVGGRRARARLRARGEAHRHGQRRGGRALRPAPRAALPRGGRRLLARLRRSARAHLRARGLGPRLRAAGRRGGEGDEVPAALPRLDARRRSGRTTASRRRTRRRAASTRRCSTRSSTARSRRSRWRRSRTRRASRRPSDGLAFPPCGAEELPRVLRPRREAACSSARARWRSSRACAATARPVPRDLRWGVYVVFEAPSDYAARCFAEYGLITDASGRYSALYRPSHLIGLELGISVASVGLRREPTGAPRAWAADAVATAKRDLAAGRAARRRGRDSSCTGSSGRRRSRAASARSRSASPTACGSAARCGRGTRCARPTSRSTREPRRCRARREMEAGVRRAGSSADAAAEALRPAADVLAAVAAAAPAASPRP